VTQPLPVPGVAGGEQALANDPTNCLTDTTYSRQRNLEAGTTSI